MSYCVWFERDDLTRRYHEEWGTPVYDDRLHFEILSLEVMQCGLSFRLILKKRELLRRLFSGFDFERIALFDTSCEHEVMAAPGMIRSAPKIRAIITNAQAFIRVRKDYGSFSDFVWGFCGSVPILYEGHENGMVPASNALSLRLSSELKKIGFKYIGPVAAYSYLQACGIINDHDKNCPRRAWLLEHFAYTRQMPEKENGLNL